MSDPYPPKLSYEPDTGDLQCDGAHVAHLADVEEFPCLDEEEDDLDDIQAQIHATGHALAERYNAHDRLTAAVATLREACDREAARLEHMEAMELDGELPHGRDCGDVARRLRAALAATDPATK